ncbi:hypothetical protein QMP26_05910 [Enterocloster clostridioformis]|uniref:hypothetical protein n=1 Tax=Enterocloster clostridioformis TaxID=1531 RepID=UPI0026771CE9|nr:hypothetical protein [Enterocloster clostridioformis]
MDEKMKRANKLPPIEKIYEAYTAVSDHRIDLQESSALVKSSDGKKTYQVEWQANLYASTDSASYWQGYAGYPIIGVLILGGKLQIDASIMEYFSGVNWNELNKKHKRDYRKALLEVFEIKGLTQTEIQGIEEKTAQAYEQLKLLNIQIVRKIKR